MGIAVSLYKIPLVSRCNVDPLALVFLIKSVLLPRLQMRHTVQFISYSIVRTHRLKNTEKWVYVEEVFVECVNAVVV